MDAALYERAIARTSAVVSGIDKGQLDDPTPCTEWKVRDVLNHLIGSLHGIAAGARGEKLDADHPEDYAASDFVSEFESASRAAIAAFSESGAMEKKFTMSWGDTPGSALIGVSTTEAAIHGSDLARGTNQSYEIDPDVADASYEMVKSMMEPNGNFPRGDSFAAPIEVPDDAPTQVKLLAYVGRDPS
jgi:uncharacterized protein (TIGR03086 family)